MNDIPGTAGYGENADVLADQYESITFEEVYRPLLEYLPAGGRALDIGAGTGRDAAALVKRGFQVHAAEPTAEMRAHARRLHPDLAIAWTDDALPDLRNLCAVGLRFDLVLMTAVWMHLDAGERSRALPRIAEFLAPDGRLFMTVRRGPIPPGRRMFDVPIDELTAGAGSQGLRLLGRYEAPDMLGREGVSWSKLAFGKSNRL